jgi:hypothetical protein
MKMMKDPKVCCTTIEADSSLQLTERETQLRMKTGKVEEVSEHIKVLVVSFVISSDSFALAHDKSPSNHGRSSQFGEGNLAKSKRKADLEDKAGEVLRDMAMRGLVRTKGLLDISELDSASICEKQGQRK